MLSLDVRSGGTVSIDRLAEREPRLGWRVAPILPRSVIGYDQTVVGG